MELGLFCRRKVEMEQRVFQIQKLGVRWIKGRRRLCDLFFYNQKDVHPGLQRPFSLRLSEGKSDSGEGEQDLGGGSGALPGLQLWAGQRAAWRRPPDRDGLRHGSRNRQGGFFPTWAWSCSGFPPVKRKLFLAKEAILTVTDSEFCPGPWRESLIRCLFPPPGVDGPPFPGWWLAVDEQGHSGVLWPAPLPPAGAAVWRSGQEGHRKCGGHRLFLEAEFPLLQLNLAFKVE